MQQEQQKNVLIVGAGPVGLAAALFLTKNPSVKVDIIEKLTEPPSQLESKALLVNPRTIQIFKGFKTQQRIAELALTNMHASFATPNWEIGKLNISEEFARRHPLLGGFFIYPQNCTSQLIEEELNERGVRVRRGVELEKLVDSEEGVRVKLSNAPEERRYDVVLGADGARSKVRKELGIQFHGQEVNTLLRVADYEIMGEPWRQARIVFGNPEFVLYLPVRDNIMRVVTNFAGRQDFLEKNAGVSFGQKVWSSEFILRNMHVDTMSKGNVYLAGDAAHIHIPMGGRGMNMGIEDAFVFANLLREGRLHQYSSLRMPVVQAFIQRVSKSAMLVDDQPSWKKTLMPYLVKIGMKFASGQILDFMGGVDHPIPFLD